VPAWSASSALAAAVIWDLLLGEFPARLHPVVWVGGVIDRLLPLVPRGRPARELAGGLLLTAFVCVGAWIAAASLLVATASYPVVQWLLCVFLLKSAFSIRALGTAAEGVRKPLLAGDLESARSGLRSLCSRDAGRLDARRLAAATVESIAENTSDSVVAPLFWFVVAGAPGAVFYRAANTLDAMIGYRGQLEFVGKAAARLDDVLNWIPARLTALLLFAGGLVTGKASANAARIAARDSRKTASPNAGWPMSMMAGLLGVSLEKEGEYSLGEHVGPVEHETIVASWRVAAKAMGLAVLAAACFVGFVR
jgi:adenosylcobinamide-phosphate synthase